jgi:hypothetical protein
MTATLKSRDQSLGSLTLNFIKSRFASREQLILLFAACVFIIHVWSIISVLREVPAWVLRLNFWDLIGVIAYTQLYALAESVVVFLVLIIVAAVLPSKLFRDKLVALGTMVVLITSIWFVFAHYYDHVIRLWGLRQFLFVFLAFLVSILIPYVLIQRYSKIADIIVRIIEFISVLAYVYVFLDVISIIIIVIRNI